MKDVTTTSFGLLIAFFLPGFAALLALGYWIPPFKDTFAVFLTAESNVGLFLLVALASVAISLIVATIRWVVFEELILRGTRLPADLFAKLIGQQDRMVAYQGAVDAHYRFHQFHGGMALVLPLLYAGWGSGLGLFRISWQVIPLHLAILGVEVVMVWGAIDAYRKYVSRGSQILKGGTK